MTEHQILKVTDCWRQMNRLREHMVRSFFYELFTAAPQVRHLFGVNFTGEVNRLIFKLNHSIYTLRPFTFSVQPGGDMEDDYSVDSNILISKCLLSVVRANNLETWDDELELAWELACDEVSGMLMKADFSMHLMNA